MAAMTGTTPFLSRTLLGLSRLTGSASRVAAGPIALPLARLSRCFSMKAEAMTSSETPGTAGPARSPSAMPSPTEAAAGSVWSVIRTAAVGTVWFWRVATAPIRLVVWVAEAIVTLSMAAILIGIAAWFAGLVPDALLLKLAHPLTEKLASLLSHALSAPSDPP